MNKLVLCITLFCVAGCTLLEPPPPPPQKEIVISPDAPKAIGPYSQAVKFGNTVYCSGQLGIDPATGDLVLGDIQAETRQVLKNLGAVLKATDMSYENVIKATVFLDDINNYKLVNEVYAEFFTSSAPAREAVQVAKLPLNGRVEISCIAAK